jgi:hypothetical protein
LETLIRSLTNWVLVDGHAFDHENTNKPVHTTGSQQDEEEAEEKKRDG